MNPEGSGHPSQEPESYVIPITLRVATVIVYQIFKNFTSKKKWNQEIGNSLECSSSTPRLSRAVKADEIQRDETPPSHYRHRQFKKAVKARDFVPASFEYTIR